MKNIAIIPARSGSKGLKDKNIKELAGKPMLAYTIEAAIKSRCFDEVHVSTDSELYAEIAQKYGAKVPFIRAMELAGDTIGTWDVVRMVLEKYKKDYSVSFESIALLQPTSPLRKEQHIVEAYRLFEEKEADFLVGVCQAEHNPLWMNTLQENQSMDQFINLSLLSGHRQGLPVYYQINGAIYIGKVQYILNNVDYYRERSYAYIMDKVASVDVDDELDFAFAEYLMTRK